MLMALLPKGEHSGRCFLLLRPSRERGKEKSCPAVRVRTMLISIMTNLQDDAGAARAVQYIAKYLYRCFWAIVNLLALVIGSGQPDDSLCRQVTAGRIECLACQVE